MYIHPNKKYIHMHNLGQLLCGFTMTIFNLLCGEIARAEVLSYLK